MRKDTEIYIRNITFGVTDSLVSTVRLLSGIDISGTTSRVIIMTGIIYAFVEAFSMAVGTPFRKIIRGISRGGRGSQTQKPSCQE